MNRNSVIKTLKRCGIPFALLQDGIEITRFNGVLNSTAGSLAVAEIPLAIGDTIHPLANPQNQWLIVDTHQTKFYQEHVVVKLNLTASVSRFTAEGARDSFGRTISAAAMPVYADIPFHLYAAVKAKDDDTKDRAGVDADYTLVCSDCFLLLPKDRLVCNGMTLVVSTILLSVDGLTKVRAVAEV